MDATTRYVLGFLLLFAIQLLLGTTAIFFARRRTGIAPVWSWPRTLPSYLLLVLLSSAIGLVPLFGSFAAAIVMLVGLKRLTGLDVLSTFILAFFVGICVVVLAMVIDSHLHVHLLPQYR